jgi:SAM-dependent methyltransferase
MAQRRFGGFSHFSIDSKVAQGSSLLECLAELPEPLSNWSAVEIGTGWTPILPILFWLNGQKQCDTYDNQRLLKDSLVVESARQFVALCHAESGLCQANVKQTSVNQTSAKQTSAKQSQFRERLNLLEKLVAEGASSSEVMRGCNIRYHAPVDATNTGLGNESVDIVYSNTTLEHAREEEISSLLRESYRIMRPGGYMLHLIDLSDHFAHSDQLITAINFLQFSEREFSKYNSRFLYQNRLREPRWRQIIQGHGFEIVSWKTHVDAKALKQLSTLPLAPAFASFSSEELCVSSIHLIARRP